MTPHDTAAFVYKDIVRNIPTYSPSARPEVSPGTRRRIFMVVTYMHSTERISNDMTYTSLMHSSRINS